MHTNTLNQIREKLNNALRITHRIEKSTDIEPIDVDSLLEEIRGAYNKVYQLGWEEEQLDELNAQQLSIVPHYDMEAAEAKPKTLVDATPDATATSEEEEAKIEQDEKLQMVADEIAESDEDETQNWVATTAIQKPETEEEEEEVLKEIESEEDEESEGEEDEEDEDENEEENSESDEEDEVEENEVAEVEETELSAPLTLDFDLAPSVPQETIKPSTSPEINFDIQTHSAKPEPELKYPSIKIDANHPPVSDLRTALSINDKFSLSNKLFNGNGTAFNLSLNVLNGFNNVTEARNYLQTLQEQNNWPIDSSDFILLCELVERRYFRS